MPRRFRWVGRLRRCWAANALFRKQIVEFESAHLEIEPGAVTDVVETHKDMLKVKSAGRIGGRKQVERDVFLQSSTGVEVEAAQIKAGTRDALDRRAARRRSGCVGVNLDLAGAHAVPDRRDTEDHRPISRVLPDRGVAIVHELVAVVFELLSKVVQHRPGLVASRAPQPILSGESREGLRGRTASEHHGCQN